MLVNSIMSHLIKKLVRHSLPSRKAWISEGGKKLLLTIAFNLAFGGPICGMQTQEEKDKLGRYAAVAQNVDELRDFIARGANINYVSEIGTPLMVFAANGDYDMVKEILKHGAKVNLQGGPGNSSALINTAIHGRRFTAKELIQAGADIYAKTDYGATALVKVADFGNGDTDVIELVNKVIFATMILQKATQLTKNEKDSIKNWLLLNQRLRENKEVFLPKDPRTIVAKKIYESLPESLRERVIRAGAPDALKKVQEAQFDPGFLDHIKMQKEMIQLIEKYLDPKFLEQRVREQLPKMSSKLSPN